MIAPVQTPSWPPEIPGPVVNTYALNPVDPAIRTDMEAGAARSRRRTLARNDRVDVGWIFTDAEMALFRAWFDDPLNGNGGSVWFTVDLALGTGGIVSATARFAGVWKATLLSSGLIWSVTATLEIRDAG